MWRISLIEPLVDPAEAPSSVTPNSTIDVSAVHSAKSALANPVVVIIDTVLKTPARIASSPSSTSWLTSPTITTSDAAANSAERDPELLVAAEDAELPADDARVEQREVRARDDHEDDDHPLRGRRERLERARVGREARGGDRRERDRDGVVERHPLVDAGEAEDA